MNGLRESITWTIFWLLLLSLLDKLIQQGTLPT